MATANPAARTPAAAADSPAPARGKKKLFLILGAVLLVVLAAGAATAYVVMQKRIAAAQAASMGLGGEAAEAEHKKPVETTPPTFLPLEPFVVNLADKDSDRFAQVGVTLEVHDSATADKLRAYMPAIRNGVLLVLAQKGSAELLSAEGKRALATEIMREATRPLEGTHITGEDGKPRPPVRAVHFSSFIIQ
jgi:flagellar FliL protein